MENKMGPALRAHFESLQAGDLIDVDIFLYQEPLTTLLDNLIQKQPDSLTDRVDRVSAIKEAASESQNELLAYLEGGHSDSGMTGVNSASPNGTVKGTSWINNSIAAEITREALTNILARDDVAHVEIRRDIQLEEMLDGSTSPLDAPGLEASTSAVLNAIGIAENANVKGSNYIEPAPTESLRLMNAPLLWDEGLKGEGVIVAIVDSGVNYNHPDLNAQMWDGGLTFPNHGFDFLSNDPDPNDDAGGHGTACAGLIAGNGASGTITGVAPKATIMAVRVGKTLRAIYDGLMFAIEHGADVISFSLTEKRAGPFGIKDEPDNFGWRATCETILASLVMHANSTGKNGQDLELLPTPYNIGPPGSCPSPRLHPFQTPRGGVTSALSCGATNDNDVLHLGSGHGPVAWDSLPYVDYPVGSVGSQGLTKPDLCAPGVNTITCNSNFITGSSENPYVRFTGTSASTAYVSGCMALLVQACKRDRKPVVAARIQKALEERARPIAGQSKKKENNFGAGRVDVYEAYLYGQKLGWWD